MNDFNTPNLEKPRTIFAAQSGNRFQFSSKGTDSLPLLEPPKDFGISFKGSGMNKILLPAVDKLLNDYTNETLPILFTARFIELIDQKFDLYDPTTKNSKLSFASTTYYQMTNFTSSMISYGRDKALAFYFNDAKTTIINPIGGSSPIEIFNPSGEKKTNKINELIQSIVPIRQRYFEELKKTTYPSGKTSINLNDTNANFFLDYINPTVEKYVFEYFLTARARILEHLPDDIINDPRFKVSAQDARWNEYDETIKKEVAFYNQKFNGVGGFVPLDWRYVKAMVWTECLAGPQGNPKEWLNSPLQIGRRAADKGYLVISRQMDNSDLITPQELVDSIQDKSKMVGNLNIRAGIAYLYQRALEGEGHVVWEDRPYNPQIFNYTVTDKDNKGFSGIAKDLGTTEKNLKDNNPEVNSSSLRAGILVKYQKSRMERIIKGWNDWRTTIYNYNGGGDPNYMPKLDKAYQIITSRTK